MKEDVEYLPLFRMPRQMKITGRSSSITNAFINSIIPVIEPTGSQVKQALRILGMTAENIQCTYCGSSSTEWDHLRPLVLNKKPTGYISEIYNLIPACGKCNQSKGNKSWSDWMVSDAKLSPKSRGIKDIDIRLKRLADYEAWKQPTIVDFEAVIGKEKWEQHWDNWELVQNTMKQAQVLATEINKSMAALYSLKN